MIQKIKNACQLFREQGVREFRQTLRRYFGEKKELEARRRLSQSFHLISKEERARQCAYRFASPVKFSILTPLFNTPEPYLKELLASLKRQTYPNWELCLLDASDDEHRYVQEICEKASASDKRIVYQRAKENLGISGNTNACLAMATGEYVGLLDHDDVLHESALFEMMKVIDEQGADFLYSDEVKFSGKIEDADDFNFKPAFGKDELRSHNYICHFTVFLRSLLPKTEQAYRPAFDGSQDHDMVLRLTERAKKIVHLPKVLYYWRVHPDSVSMNLDSKSYAVDAAIHAIEEQLARTGEAGTVASNLPYRTIYRVRYALPEHAPVSVLIHHLSDSMSFETVCENVRARTAYPELEFIAVECSKGESFGSAVNRAVQKASGEYLVLLDAACIPAAPDWIGEMLMFAIRSDVCAVSPKICDSEDRIRYAGLAVDSGSESKLRFLCHGIPDADQGFEAMLRHVRNTTAVWKVCCLFSRRMFETLGGFSENMPDYEEIDFSLKGVKHQFWNVWTCFAKMIYDGTDLADGTKPPQPFVTCWSEALRQEDPYCHPYLKQLKLL